MILRTKKDLLLSLLISAESICCRRSSKEDDSNLPQAITHHSSTATIDGWSYDVFLSFRSEDTRKTFTDHLYAALDQVGVRTFRDNDELERGEAIGPNLLKAIQESRIWIPVFSRNYAFSKWRLEELVQMVDCRDRIGQTVLPISVDVDPSDVRNQTGCFARAFCQHEKRYSKEVVGKWRRVLTEAGQLSG